jgi:hypothetical protein
MRSERVAEGGGVGRGRGLCLPVIPAVRRLRQEDHKLKVSLSYIMRPSLKRPKRRDLKNEMEPAT